VIGMQLRTAVVLRCGICGQIRDSDRVADSVACVALFGAVAYAQCPSCHQIVTDFKDRNYRARARRFVARLTRAQLRIGH
jgi:hypothetical protein